MRNPESDANAEKEDCYENNVRHGSGKRYGRTRQPDFCTKDLADIQEMNV